MFLLRMCISFFVLLFIIFLFLLFSFFFFFFFFFFPFFLHNVIVWSSTALLSVCVVVFSFSLNFFFAFSREDKMEYYRFGPEARNVQSLMKLIELYRTLAFEREQSLLIEVDLSFDALLSSNYVVWASLCEQVHVKCEFLVPGGRYYDGRSIIHQSRLQFPKVEMISGYLVLREPLCLFSQVLLWRLREGHLHPDLISGLNLQQSFSFDPIDVYVDSTMVLTCVDPEIFQLLKINSIACSDGYVLVGPSLLQFPEKVDLLKLYPELFVFDPRCCMLFMQEGMVRIPSDCTDLNFGNWLCLMSERGNVLDQVTTLVIQERSSPLKLPPACFLLKNLHSIKGPVEWSGWEDGMDPFFMRFLQGQERLEKVPFAALALIHFFLPGSNLRFDSDRKLKLELFPCSSWEHKHCSLDVIIHSLFSSGMMDKLESIRFLNEVDLQLVDLPALEWLICLESLQEFEWPGYPFVKDLLRCKFRLHAYAEVGSLEPLPPAWLRYLTPKLSFFKWMDHGIGKVEYILQGPSDAIQMEQLLSSPEYQIYFDWLEHLELRGQYDVMMPRTLFHLARPSCHVQKVVVRDCFMTTQLKPPFGRERVRQSRTFLRNALAEMWLPNVPMTFGFLDGECLTINAVEDEDSVIDFLDYYAPTMNCVKSVKLENRQWTMIYPPLFQFNRLEALLGTFSPDLLKSVGFPVTARWLSCRDFMEKHKEARWGVFMNHFKHLPEKADARSWSARAVLARCLDVQDIRVFDFLAEVSTWMKDVVSGSLFLDDIVGTWFRTVAAYMLGIKVTDVPVERLDEGLVSLFRKFDVPLSAEELSRWWIYFYAAFAPLVSESELLDEKIFDVVFDECMSMFKWLEEKEHEEKKRESTDPEYKKKKDDARKKWKPETGHLPPGTKLLGATVCKCWNNSKKVLLEAKEVKKESEKREREQQKRAEKKLRKKEAAAMAAEAAAAAAAAAEAAEAAALAAAADDNAAAAAAVPDVPVIAEVEEKSAEVKLSDCAGSCGRTNLGKEHFAAKMWRQKAGRKCKECVKGEEDKAAREREAAVEEAAQKEAAEAAARAEKQRKKKEEQQERARKQWQEQQDKEKEEMARVQAILEKKKQEEEEKKRLEERMRAMEEAKKRLQEEERERSRLAHEAEQAALEQEKKLREEVFRRRKEMEGAPSGPTPPAVVGVASSVIPALSVSANKSVLIPGSPAAAVGVSSSSGVASPSVLSDDMDQSIARSTARLREMLAELKLEQYVDTLHQLGCVTVKQFSVLSEEQFEKIGVKKFHLKKLLELQKSIKALKFDDERERFCEQDSMTSDMERLVEDVGAAAAQHVRPTMEDEHLVARLSAGIGFFGVFDGHGGRQVATFCKQNLHELLRDILASQQPRKQRPLQSGATANVNVSQQIEDTLKRAFLECDEKIALGVEGSLGCGATAGVVLVRKEGGRRLVHVANCGDVRATLCRGPTAVRLSVDHKADTVEERARVEAAGGQVIGRRVQGVLAVARALGDHALKRFVTGEPYVATVELQAEDTHLVLACDGLWDVMSDQDVCDIIRDMPEETSCLNVAKHLISKAITLRTSDNITVVVTKLISQNNNKNNKNSNND